MLSESLSEILSLQENMLSLMPKCEIPDLQRLSATLVENCNQLLHSLSKTKLYGEFNSYFAPNEESESDLSELTFTPSDFDKVKTFLQNSTQLSREAHHMLLKSDAKASEDTQSSQDYRNSLMEPTEEFQSRLLASSQTTSLAVDLGGTLIKVMFKLKECPPEYVDFFKLFYAGYLYSSHLLNLLSSHSKQPLLNHKHQHSSQMLEFYNSLFLGVTLKGEFYTFKFLPISHLDHFVSSIKGKNLHTPGKSLNLTGGGSVKFYDFFSKHFQGVKKVDEVTCVVSGLTLLQKMPNSMVKYDLVNRLPQPLTLPPLYPYVVSSVGTGTFFLKVRSTQLTPTRSTPKNSSPTSLELPFREASEPSFNANLGTAFGLLNYLLPLNSQRTFDKLFKTGTNKLDSFTNFPSTQFQTSNKSEPYGLYQSLENFKSHEQNLQPEDLNRSLLDMVSYNTGCLGYLVAKAVGAKRLICLGNYTCSHTMESLAAGFSYTSDLYNDKSVELCFPLHSPYVSTLGSFMAN